jgi:hypothetical protein
MALEVGWRLQLSKGDEGQIKREVTHPHHHIFCQCVLQSQPLRPLTAFYNFYSQQYELYRE